MTTMKLITLTTTREVDVVVFLCSATIKSGTNANTSFGAGGDRWGQQLGAWERGHWGA
jgi:hypothetical protein